MLCRLARAAIANELGQTLPIDDSAPWLKRPGACFVTLTRGGRLAGCIGSLEPRRTLRDDVLENARAAAFRDPRFSPTTAADLGRTRLEVTVLSPTVPMPVAGEAEAIAQLRPGIDGVVLEYDGRRGTFLPQVWAKLADPREFLQHLKVKARLPGDFWDDGIRLSRYTVSAYEEEHPP